MKTGQCPKCESLEIYTAENGIYIPKLLGTFIRTGPSNAGSTTQDYICANCGYIERFVIDNDKLKEITKTWKRVSALT